MQVMDVLGENIQSKVSGGAAESSRRNSGAWSFFEESLCINIANEKQIDMMYEELEDTINMVSWIVK